MIRSCTASISFASLYLLLSCSHATSSKPSVTAKPVYLQANEGRPAGNELAGRCEAPRQAMVQLSLSSEAARKNGNGFPSASCVHRAVALTALLSLDEKVGQIMQPNVRNLQGDDTKEFSLGSVLSGGGSGPPSNTPQAWAKMVNEQRQLSLQTDHAIPMLYGVDAVHGHNNVQGATIFPHNIGLGATRDADLVERIGHATAVEVRATGIEWTFSPVVAAARDERWGRTYESFGEAPELVEKLGPALIRGLQGAELGKSSSSVLACAKHYLGDGYTQSGIDRGQSTVDEQVLQSQLLPAYQRSIEAGVGSIMVSFNVLNGVRMHCNGPMLNDTLKGQLGFGGFLVSDWKAVDLLPAENYAQQLQFALNSGLDMIMQPKGLENFRATVVKLVESEKVSQARIDDAVHRILAVKCEMGLLDSQAYSKETGARIGENEPRPDIVGSAEHRALAREAVQKSLVLLKNKDGILPLSQAHSRWHLAGNHADDLGTQMGGWTITWRGRPGPTTQGTTFLQAFQALSPSHTKVSFSADGSGVAGADAAIVFVGEQPYAEWYGDSQDLTIPSEQLAVAKRAKDAGVPLIVVIVSGRPLVLGPLEQMADAIVAAWLPGSEGEGLVDVLLGRIPFTGKLPHSWPRSMAQIPINIGDSPYAPLYDYGFGLSASPKTVNQ